jgi:hypothetical protein
MAQRGEDMSHPTSMWIRRWTAVFLIAEYLLDLQIDLNATRQQRRQIIFDRVVELRKALPWEDELNQLAFSLGLMETAEIDSYDLTTAEEQALVAPSAEQAKLQQIAGELLLFSAQHFAFLLDSLSRERPYYFQLVRSFDPKQIQAEEGAKLNVFRNALVDKHLGEIGDLSAVSHTIEEYVLRRVVNHTSSDVLLLHKMWMQYTQNPRSIVVRKLLQSNDLAGHVWASFKKYLAQTDAPLTYIRETASVRLIPYGSIPLIAVPASALAIPADYLAIPHEFGHFLFWRGWIEVDVQDGSSATSIQDRLLETAWRKASSWSKPWFEEIFADVIGTLVGGPAAALSLQDMMLEKAGKLFTEDDGHYPIPAVRPYAALAVLGEIGLRSSANVLTRRWQDILEHRFKAKVGDIKLSVPLGENREDACEGISVVDIIANLTEVSKEIVRLFVEDGWNAADYLWTDEHDFSPETRPNMFYDQFEERLPSLKASLTSANLPDDESDSTAWLQVIKPYLSDRTHTQLSRLYQQEGGDWIFSILQQKGASAGNPILLSPKEWFSILYLGGWGDAGPTGGSPHVT